MTNQDAGSALSEQAPKEFDPLECKHGIHIRLCKECWGHRPTDEELDEVVGWAVFWFVAFVIAALVIGLWVS